MLYLFDHLLLDYWVECALRLGHLPRTLKGRDGMEAPGAVGGAARDDAPVLPALQDSVGLRRVDDAAAVRAAGQVGHEFRDWGPWR